MQKKVLFISVQNSFRSQIAEGWLNYLAKGILEAQSAGLEPCGVDSLAIEVMKEVGIDISQKKSQTIFDVYKSGKAFSYVIRVSEKHPQGRGPLFPSTAKRFDWNFPAPVPGQKTEEHPLQKAREIRDRIRAEIENWLEEERKKLGKSGAK